MDAVEIVVGMGLERRRRRGGRREGGAIGLIGVIGVSSSSG
jgi:hypothetical protein